MKHVIIVTTMWDAVSADVGKTRLQQLKDEYFNDAMLHGVRVARHNNTAESAVGILGQLVGAGAQPNVLQIQREMFDYHNDVADTGAGKELMGQLDAEATKLEREAQQKEREEQQLVDELRLAREDLSRTRTEREELRDGIQRIRTALEQVRKERDTLRRALDDALKARIQTVIAQILRTTNNITEVHGQVSNMRCCPIVYADGTCSVHRTVVTRAP